MLELVSEQQRKERLAICESCEFLTKVNICSKCGCFMPAKTKFSSSSCPIKKWTAMTEESRNEF